VINDDNLIFDGNSPHLRFINVSTDQNSSLGLAFSVFSTTPTPKPAPTVESPVTPEVTPDGNLPNVVYTLPFGVQKLVDNVAAGSASSIILMPTGDVNLEIIESVDNKLALTIPKVSLEADVHVDVIAYQDPNLGNISAFAVPYPKPQA
jgi:hypothetical protein